MSPMRRFTLAPLLAILFSSPMSASPLDGHVQHPTTNDCGVWEFDEYSEQWVCIGSGGSGGGHQVGDVWCSGNAAEHPGWTVKVLFIQQAGTRSECSAWLYGPDGQEAPEGGWLGNGDCQDLCDRLVTH